MSGPLYDHDCDQCRFLGSWFNIDVYLTGAKCNAGITSVISRFSSEGSRYTSMPLYLLRQNIAKYPGWTSDAIREDWGKAILVALAVQGVEYIIGPAEESVNA